MRNSNNVIVVNERKSVTHRRPWPVFYDNMFPSVERSNESTQMKLAVCYQQMIVQSIFFFFTIWIEILLWRLCDAQNSLWRHAVISVVTSLARTRFAFNIEWRRQVKRDKYTLSICPFGSWYSKAKVVGCYESKFICHFSSNVIHMPIRNDEEEAEKRERRRKKYLSIWIRVQFSSVLLSRICFLLVCVCVRRVVHCMVSHEASNISYFV